MVKLYMILIKMSIIRNNNFQISFYFFFISIKYIYDDVRS